MKNVVKDEVRAIYVKQLMEIFEKNGEDVGMIASNSFNFPICYGDDECVIEIVVKIPKDDNDSLAKRDEYRIKCEEQKQKKAEAEAQKQKKIDADKKKREEKERAKAEGAE